MIEKSLLQLALGKGVGKVYLKKTAAFLERAGCSWSDCVNDRALLLRAGLRESMADSVASAREQAEAMYETLLENNVDMVTENDKDYPQYLKRTLGKKCPPLLFLSGNRALLNETSVGFCGSRKTSERGISVAGSCAKQLAQAGVTVVSGYAGGADMAAHKEALLSGGNTIFVLAEGILRYSRKKEIRELLTGKNHVFVSQYMPDAVWLQGRAMERNGTIIGLSRAMILVESALSGGTFSAGEEALEAGCPLFVLEFKQPDASAEGNAHFIASGGIPIRGKNGVPNLSKVFRVIQQDARSGQAAERRPETEDPQIKIEL